MVHNYFSGNIGPGGRVIQCGDLNVGGKPRTHALPDGTVLTTQETEDFLDQVLDKGEAVVKGVVYVRKDGKIVRKET